MGSCFRKSNQFSSQPRSVTPDFRASNASQAKQFLTNYIKTTHYTLLTFLPACLLDQFRQYANIYFLFVSILDYIPAIAPVQSFTSIAPLCFVLTVSLIREGLEDYVRYKQDKEQNSSQIT